MKPAVTASGRMDRVSGGVGMGNMGRMGRGEYEGAVKQEGCGWWRGVDG